MYRAIEDEDPQMIDAVTNGRAGTAMVSFASVVAADEIAAVVSYIRDSFMQNDKATYSYHTRENGWKEHHKYAAAFPFASGEIPLDTPWPELSDEQIDRVITDPSAPRDMVDALEARGVRVQVAQGDPS